MPGRSTANCSTVAAPRHCCYLNMFTVNPVTAAAMVDLLAQYEQHGLQLNSRELPDHLPLYLSTAQLPQSEAVEGLKDIAPILALLSARLQQRESRYAVLFDLLLKLANTAIDRQSGGKIADEARDDTPQALDAVWEEEQVKFFAEKAAVIQQSLLISVALPVPSRRNI